MLSGSIAIYLVADPDHVGGDIVKAVSSAIDGGVSCVQLRAKSLTDREHLQLALNMRAICGEKGVPFLVNDRLDIALASNADGIHLGVDDLPVAAVRALAPQGFIIGFSPELDEQIIGSGPDGADYLGVGPVFSTRTKSDAGEALGLRELARRCALSPVPVVGIGGISALNARSVIDAGASGVAVVSAILASHNPAGAAENLRCQSGILNSSSNSGSSAGSQR